MNEFRNAQIHTWFRCGGSSIGTSHLKQRTACQDRAACTTLVRGEDEFLIAIVSDGAGSAKYGGEGAQTLCQNLSRSIRTYFRNGGTIDELDKKAVEQWLRDVRNRLEKRAISNDVTSRQFAATFVALIADHSSFICIAVGDSILAVQPQLDDWSVPIAPMTGEYASSTVFVTQNPFPEFGFFKSDQPLHRAALFTDGLEKIAFSSKRIIKGEFLASLFDAVAESIAPGHVRSIDAELRDWLASDAVCEHTDDDKTLLLVQSISPQTDEELNSCNRNDATDGEDSIDMDET